MLSNNDTADDSNDAKKPLKSDENNITDTQTDNGLDVAPPEAEQKVVRLKNVVLDRFIRYTILALICSLTFGSYFCYDMPGVHFVNSSLGLLHEIL